MCACELQIKESMPMTMSSYVKNIYGKHVLTDEPVDYVQQSVPTSDVCLSVCGVFYDQSSNSDILHGYKKMSLTTCHISTVLRESVSQSVSQ